MKKKIALTAVIIFVLASAGYGTYAYMTASKTAQNIITAGNVKIELNEVTNEQNKSAGELTVMPSTNAKYEVSVTNTGKNACYVRVKLNTKLNIGEALLSSEGKITLLLDNINWVQDTEGYWRYKVELAPGKTSSNLLTEIAFDKSMGNEYQNATFNLSVSAQAVQAVNNGFVTSVLEVKGWPSTPAPSPSGPT